LKTVQNKLIDDRFERVIIFRLLWK